MTQLTARAALAEGASVPASSAIATEAIDVGHMVSIALVTRAVSTGTADVSYDFAISADGVNFGPFDNAIGTNSGEDWEEFVVVVLGARYIKVQVTNNDGVTAVTMDSYLSFQEQT